MAKAHECPLAAVCAGVREEEWREVAFNSFNSPRLRTCGDCRKKLLNDTNGRQKLIVRVVKVSSLVVLPKVAIAGKVF